MKLSKDSDESWQYCFNIIEGRTLRWISKIFNHQKGEQIGAWETSMGKMRTKDKKIASYETIYKKLFEVFPEFKEKLIQKLGNK